QRREWLPRTSPPTYKDPVEQTPSAVSPTPRPNWWKRNWKWFVPVGCFSIAVLFVAFVAAVVLIVFSAVKSTDVYKDALTRAKAHPAVIRRLVRLLQRDFFSRETRTSTARPVKRISPFPSPVQREKEQFT